MDELIYNNDDLKEEDITYKEVRVKVLLINSNNEILIGFAHNTYQFIGGHVEENESLVDAIKREVKEETGINIKLKNMESFFTIKYFLKDYPKIGKNKGVYIYYYVIYTDLPYNLNNVCYTEDEKIGHFELKYIQLDKLENILINSTFNDLTNKTIIHEMLEAIKIYNNKYNVKI